VRAATAISSMQPRSSKRQLLSPCCTLTSPSRRQYVHHAPLRSLHPYLDYACAMQPCWLLATPSILDERARLKETNLWRTHRRRKFIQSMKEYRRSGSDAGKETRPISIIHLLWFELPTLEPRRKKAAVI